MYKKISTSYILIISNLFRFIKQFNLPNALFYHQNAFYLETIKLHSNFIPYFISIYKPLRYLPILFHILQLLYGCQIVIFLCFIYYFSNSGKEGSTLCIFPYISPIQQNLKIQILIMILMYSTIFILCMNPRCNKTRSKGFF